MEQERKRLTQEQITDAVNQFRKGGLSDAPTIELVRSDLEYGLLAEEIALYANKRFRFSQKQLISKAIREYGIKLAKAIAREDMDEQAMEMAMEYCGQGVPVETIADSIAEQHSAYSLRHIYQDVLAEIRETEAEINEDEEEDEAGVDREFVQQMIGEMKEIALAIKQDSIRYGALSEKVQEISVSKKAEAELEKQNAEVERLEGEITTLNNTNVNLRKMLEDKEKQIVQLEKKLQEKSEEQTKTQMPYMSGYPIYPQGVMGHPQGIVYMEKAKPKKNSLAALFGKSDTRKPSKQDITKLVASGQLNTQQLMQVKVAISRGLTDEQLCDLIQGNVSAEQMKEIIEIAVLENSMR